jgi:MFS family permease
VFSLTLPKTPPATGTGEKNAPMEALKYLAIPAFGVLFFVTFLDALVHQCYFQYTSSFLEKAGLPGNWIMPAMSIGQIAEILTMASLAYFLKRLGWRTIMIFGILGHAARFFIFSIGEPVWLMVAVNVLHGFCYAFFFASVYIFVDEFFPKDSRASAQGLFNLLILGLGPFVGSQLWAYIEGTVSTNTTALVGGVSTTVSAVDFHKLFLYPAGLAMLAALLLLVFFHPPKQAAGDAN